jgi:hypothetical protein
VRALERPARPGVQGRVLADQRAVEVARDGVDLPRKLGGELQPPCGFVRNWTRASMSPFGSDPYDLGIAFGKPFSM